MEHRALLRATALVLSALFVKQGTCNEPTCDYMQYNDIYKKAVIPLKFNVPFHVRGQSYSPAELKQDCEDLKSVGARTEQLVFEGCDADEQRNLTTLQSDLQSLRDSLCDQGLEEGLNYWKNCSKPDVFAECERDFMDQIRQLETDGTLSKSEAFCRSQLQPYHCALRAGADCPAKVEVARKAVENYINVQLDIFSCPRPTDCGGRLLPDCFWNASTHIYFTRLDYFLDARSLPEDCKVAKSVSTCTRDFAIERCPENEKKHVRTLEESFRSVSGYLCNEQLPASTNEWNQCYNKDVWNNCTTKMWETWTDPKPGVNLRRQCWRLEETLKCALSAAQSCPSSASLAKKAVLGFDLSLFDLADCPRPNIQGSDGDSGFSNTPKIFVTLAALLVALFPMKETLLRQLS